MTQFEIFAQQKARNRTRRRHLAAGAKQVAVLVHSANGRRHRHDEGNVLLGVVAELQKGWSLLAAHGPVVVLAASVHILEGLLVEQRLELVATSLLLQDVHALQILVRRQNAVPEEGSENAA